MGETTHAPYGDSWVIRPKRSRVGGGRLSPMATNEAELTGQARPVGRGARIAGQDAREQLLDGLPVTERRLELAGVSTAVLEGGQGPPVVLLHGPFGNAAHWMSVIPGLVESQRVIAPDLPGHGASGVTEGELDASRVLAWLGELIERTCALPPVLVGYALGGAIAARFAIERPDAVSRLVLVDALGLREFDPAPDFGAALHDFAADPSERTHEVLLQHCALDLAGLRERMGARWEPFEAYNVDRARTPSLQAALGTLMGEFGLPAIPAEELARIAVPTTLIWGRHDLATPLAAAEAVSERHGWPLHVIEGCADDPPIEQPGAFLAALRPLFTMPAPEDVQALRGRLRGQLLLPADAGFAAATLIWNGLIERTPELVVRPTGTADVVAAVDFARDHGLALGVRGGGHNIGGTALADGGLTIDMSALHGIHVDPRARTATVQPGCLLGDVDRETQLHGLAAPLGFVSEVGVAGLTLGGGLGYLTRRFGWTVDNLLEVEIVTADGKVRRAARDEHEDLFWAVRGAGANLGVVTSFTYRLHEVGPTVYGGLIAWPFERAAEIQDAYRSLTVEAPRELAVWMNLIQAPAAPFVPEEWQGERVCVMLVCYSGELEKTDEVMAPIRALGDPVVDLLGDQPYTQVQSHLDPTEPKGDHYYWKTGFVTGLDDGLLATLRELAAECPIPRAQLGVLHLGGALNERPGDDGAVGNRDVRYVIGALGVWEPGEPRADEYQDWVREAGNQLRPFSTGGNYINFQTADEGDERIRATYGANFERVQEVKRKYDPRNLFRSNRNVRP
jgi:pimeloyl-ACP methyl ester carboxylesterase